ncbi:MAG: DUF5060 domain-containing protein [Thermoguttaceae bacterium]
MGSGQTCVGVAVFAAALLGFWPEGACAKEAQVAQLTASAAKLGRYEKIELALILPQDRQYRNPFDPDEVEVWVELSTPSKAALRLPAFWYQDYQRRKIAKGGKQADWIYPVGEPGWRARFAPWETGTYTAVGAWKDRGGTGRTDPLRFEVAPSRREGFVRISKTDPRYLELDSGRPLFLIGQNLAFIGPMQHVNLCKAEEIFKTLSANGANFLRVWTCCEDWATAIEARKSAWGRSWAWRPPIVPMPGREHQADPPKCVKLAGQRGKTLDLAPTGPLAVRSATRYVFSGRLRTEGGLQLHVSIPGADLAAPLASQPDGVWTEFCRAFTTGPGQQWLDRIVFRLEKEGAAWLDGLSLKEAAGGPELLGEADVNRPVRGYYHPLDCFVVDRLVEAAEQAGIYLQLCLITRDLYMSALKDDNSREYQQAIRDAKKLMRYAVARWGYSTSVAAWEYWNELDPGLPTDRFYAELGQYFAEIDIYRHLRVTSTWAPSPKDWRHPELDMAQLHHYLRPGSKEGFHDEVAVVLERTELLRRHAPQKPILLAEFGLADDKWGLSPYMKQDRQQVHFHNCLWASALSGACGTTQFWWWEQLDLQDAYHHYRPLAAFVADIPFTTAGLKGLSASVSSQSVRPVGLQAADRAYVWLFDREATWWNQVVQKNTPPEIRGATLEIQGLHDGPYRIAWWDTYAGKPLGEQPAHASGARLRVEIPAFSRDIACKILPAR